MSQAVVTKLKGAYAGSVLEVKEYRDEVTVTVKKEDIVAICQFLKDEAGYNFLCDLCGVDYLGQQPRFIPYSTLVSCKILSNNGHTLLQFKCKYQHNIRATCKSNNL